MIDDLFFKLYILFATVVIMVLLVLVLFLNNTVCDDGFLVGEASVSKDFFKDSDWLVVGVSDKSDSMGLLLRHSDKIWFEPVELNDSLFLGGIYIYRTGNTSAVHRLVGCVDLDCNLTVFKGDNNYVAEFVPKNNITGRVVYVNYGRMYGVDAFKDNDSVWGYAFK